MTTSVERVIRAARKLSPAEQLELIQILSEALRHQYYSPKSGSVDESIKHTPPIADLADLAADFWPEDESADDINSYIAQQRHDDRTKDL